MENLEAHADQQAIRARMAAFGARPIRNLKNRDGSILLAHADFDSYEGPFESAPYLRLHLCTANVGRLRRAGADGSLVEGVIRPGTIGVTLPNFEAEGCWPKTQATNIMVHMDALSEVAGEGMTPEKLEASASTLHRDELVTSVMYAIWRDAEAHGLSSAFFDHGLALILNRLADYRQDAPAPGTRSGQPLSRPKLARVLELIESSLDTDVRVNELAQECGQDVRSFTRSFRASTGFAPYEYLTYRRMEAAKELLLAGMAVTEIALSTGYSNPSKFAAAFRRFAGCTPTQWRRERC